MMDMVATFCWGIRQKMQLNDWSLTDLSRVTGLSMGTLGKLFKKGEFPSLRTAVRLAIKVGLSEEHILLSFSEKTEQGYRLRRLLGQSAMIRGEDPWVQIRGPVLNWSLPELTEYRAEMQYELEKSRQEMDVPPELQAMTGTRQEAITTLQTLLLSLDNTDLHFWVTTLQHYISTKGRNT